MSETDTESPAVRRFDFAPLPERVELFFWNAPHGVRISNVQPVMGRWGHAEMPQDENGYPLPDAFDLACPEAARMFGVTYVPTRDVVKVTLAVRDMESATLPVVPENVIEPEVENLRRRVADLESKVRAGHLREGSLVTASNAREVILLKEIERLKSEAGKG